MNALDVGDDTHKRAAILKDDPNRITLLQAAGMLQPNDVTLLQHRASGPLLAFALQHGKYRAAATLVAAGASMKFTVDTLRDTLEGIEYFLSVNHPEAARWLARHGLPLTPDELQRIGYHELTAELLPTLVRNGSDIRGVTRHNEPILCTIGLHPTFVQTMLELGADPNATSNRGFAPLFFAGNKEATTALMHAGANVNARSESEATPLHHACSNAHDDVILTLLAAGADANARDWLGVTPVMNALGSVTVGTFRRLLEANADVNVVCDLGTTALWQAITYAIAERYPSHSPTRAVEHLQELTQAGAHTNATDSRGMTPLMHAINLANVTARSGIKARESHLEPVISILLNANADVNARTPSGTEAYASGHYLRRTSGDTAAHFLAELTHPKYTECVTRVMRAFLERGFDPSIRNDANQTVERVASEAENTALLHALHEAAYQRIA